MKNLPPPFLLCLLLLPSARSILACEPCQARLSWQQSLFLADIATIGQTTEKADNGLRGEGSPIPWRSLRLLKGDSLPDAVGLQRSATNCRTGFDPLANRTYLLFATRSSNPWKPPHHCSPYQFELLGDSIMRSSESPSSMADVIAEVEAARTLRALLDGSGWSLHRSMKAEWVLVQAREGASEPDILGNPHVRGVRRERHGTERRIFFVFGDTARSTERKSDP